MSNGSPKQPNTPEESTTGLVPISRYRILKRTIAPVVFLLSVLPVLLFAGIIHVRYERVLLDEQRLATNHVTTSAEVALETFIDERAASLSLCLQRGDFTKLSDPATLAALLSDLKLSFEGFIDLALIDPEGRQISQVGPSPGLPDDVSDQEWYHRALLDGTSVSRTLLGQHDLPLVIICASRATADHTTFVLRATVAIKVLHKRIPSCSICANSDVFLVDENGILQTPSRFYGKALEPCPLPRPTHHEHAVAEVIKDEHGETLLVGRVEIGNTPLILTVVTRPQHLNSWLSIRRDMLLYAGCSIVFIVLIAAFGTRFIVGRLQVVDRKRAAVFHNLEYTNKMAAIGRLSAGVAHEINNPLAIIEENAGLLKDLVVMSDKPLSSDKVLERVEPILGSAERCSTITHRLLGFAKHMDVTTDELNLEVLTQEVLGFLAKEASHRNLKVHVHAPPDLPRVESSRGQLQQVFLNIINNAFAAVDDNGEITISMQALDDQHVEITFTDNGIGIPKKNLKYIFEPFFSTKGGAGTGLGLSITHGIVEKLGGKISVDSEPGEGTCFTLELPTRTT